LNDLYKLLFSILFCSHFFSAALGGNKYRNKESKPKKTKRKDESGINVKFNCKLITPDPDYL